jgi:hypothetical protein
MDQLRIVDGDSFDEEVETPASANDEGLKLIAEIERLQDYVLDELDSLNERVRSVFRTFGYKEVEDVNSPDEAAV